MNEEIEKQEFPKRKINLVIILSILVIILIIALFYFVALPKYNSYEQNIGYNQGLLYVQQTGQIPYLINQSGKVILNQTSLSSYCNQWVSQQLNKNNLTIVKK